jgi:feruloyl esterase
LRPGPKSDVKAEVWMPASGWNGKLQVVGNGGFAGTIGYRALATALANGYAAASTDTGHTGPAANTFATDDATLDFAYRAIHETAVAAKRAVDGFYGAAPKFSYFNGCSTGGRQALTAAQRYPDDFTGIVGGAPAIYTTKQAFGQLWFYQAIAVGEGAIAKEKRSTAPRTACSRTRSRAGSIPACWRASRAPPLPPASPRRRSNRSGESTPAPRTPSPARRSSPASSAAANWGGLRCP